MTTVPGRKAGPFVCRFVPVLPEIVRPTLFRYK